MDIRIYQIDLEKDKNHVGFANLALTERRQGHSGIDSSLYETVFSGTVNAKSLEDVYRIFNLEHPAEHSGRSLSVSDIIEVTKQADSVKPGFYFCDSFGFKEVSFQPDKMANTPAFIKGILLEPGKKARVAETKPSLDVMQRMLGGWMEVADPFEDNAVLLRNEESKLMGLPANRTLRGEEKEVDLTYPELCAKLRAAEQVRNELHATGYVVFTQDSFLEPYSLESRTYVISSNNKAFQANMGGYSIFGSNLDGTDPVIRLDAYMANEHGGKDGWKIERCYMKEPGPVLDVLMGNVFICGKKDGNFVSLTDQQLQDYAERFRYPERMFVQDQTIHAEPYVPREQHSSLQNLLETADIKRSSDTGAHTQDQMKNDPVL